MRFEVRRVLVGWTVLAFGVGVVVWLQSAGNFAAATAVAVCCGMQARRLVHRSVELWGRGT